MLQDLAWFRCKLIVTSPIMQRNIGEPYFRECNKLGCVIASIRAVILRHNSSEPAPPGQGAAPQLKAILHHVISRAHVWYFICGK
jgi:hypothetical protein